VMAYILWAKEAYDTMAMGNYPYPSSYVMNGRSVLPAYPMRVSCSFVQDEFQGDLALLDAFSQSVGVYYNSTHDVDCYDFSAPPDEVSQFDDLWEYIICAEAYQPQSVDGVHDMFWSIPWNYTADDARCKSKWGISINPRWGVIQYGGRKALRAASNIIFSNGDLDPWSGTGVLESASESVIALKVEGGAHHLDLMFATPLDPPGVVAAREVEKQHMNRWIRQFYDHKRRLTID
jgi:lysosomal Pro-X carboxypeptidase